MKRILTILTALFTLSSAIAGSALQSACVGMIAYAATDSVTVAELAFAIPFTLSFILPASKSGYAYVVFTEGICEKVQASLIDIYGSNTPNLKRTQVGYLQALTSQTNMSGMTVLPIDPGTGKIKQVRLKYTQRGTESDLTTTKSTTCSTEIEKVPFEQTVDISNYIGTKGMKFTEAEMRKLCGPDSQWMAEIVSNEMDALAVKINKLLIAGQSSNFGVFLGGSNAVKSYPLLSGAQFAANFYGESLIMEDMENLDLMGKPIVIGSGKLGHYARMTGIGCCNTLGQDISQAGNLDFFRDRFVGGILGNVDDFIMLMPGHVQMLTFNEYVGAYAKENQVFSHGTIVDPFTGLKYDSKWHYNDCDDTYFFQMGIQWDMFYMPLTAFSAYDELRGMNGTFHGRATAI